MRAPAAVFVGLIASGIWVAAHEGHDGAVKPVYQQVQVGDATYRVGFAVQPPDVLVGEDVRLEFQFLQASSPASNTAAEAPDLQVRIVSAAATPYTVPHVSPGGKPGTYLVRHRFEESGQYGIAPRLQSGAQSIGAEFPIVVSAGPVLRAAFVVDAVVLVVLGAMVFARWRGRKERSPESPSRRAPGAALAAVGLAALVVGHVWISPAVGRMFLPERHTGPVTWDPAPPTGTAPAAEPHDHPPGTPPHSHGEEKPPAPAPHRDPPGTPPHSHPGDASRPPDAARGAAHEIVSTVVAVPGQLVDVVVPMTARILFDGFTPQVGRMVRRGQTLATLEHHYVLHDAVHLINQRWLYMVPMLAKKREALQAELNVARLRQLERTGDASVKQMMNVTQAVQTAALALATARLEQERAAKLLAMHDAQITERELVRRPLTSPIDGTIEAVNFTQGQLKYENDRLFTILDLSRVWIEARFPGDASSQPPRRMTFVSSAFPSRRFEGGLVRVAHTLDPASGTLSAFFEVPNRERLLRVGMRLAAQPPTADATAAVGTSSDVVRRAVARDDDPVAAGGSFTAVVKANPELTADVTAPLWGRIEFAGRRLSVGDRVRKGEHLINVVLELSVDERYPMNARAVEIDAELEMAKVRSSQAEDQWRQAVQQLMASPHDAFRMEESQILEKIHRGARDEATLLARQAEVYQGTIKRRDPKITVVQAPMSGVITEIGFRPGELNGTGEFRKLLTIVDTSRVWLAAQVYERQSAVMLQDFGRASFRSPGLPSDRPLGRPVAVSGAINPETGALTAIFVVANPGGTLKIGAPAQIVVARD